MGAISEEPAELSELFFFLLVLSNEVCMVEDLHVVTFSGITTTNSLWDSSGTATAFGGYATGIGVGKILRPPVVSNVAIKDTFACSPTKMITISFTLVQPSALAEAILGRSEL